MMIFDQKETKDDIKVKIYIDRYIKELQRHFDLSDRKMRLILYRVYKDLSPLNYIKIFIFNVIIKLKSMLKSKHKGYYKRIK